MKLFRLLLQNIPGGGAGTGSRKAQTQGGPVQQNGGGGQRGAEPRGAFPTRRHQASLHAVEGEHELHQHAGLQDRRNQGSWLSCVQKKTHQKNPQNRPEVNVSIFSRIYLGAEHVTSEIFRPPLLFQKCDGTCRTDFKKTRCEQDVIQVFKDFVEGNVSIVVRGSHTHTHTHSISMRMDSSEVR